eukprot:TRINITY_DN11879_c0_g1_i1.p1 TRINITY_DN11879_c0_g1~~TRINITY_DN11879_c0_g1_i1.p1  ORF type:complete len:1146 (+),score=342.31 TRINITY_DN11879_c0_g1_i1:161-3439(+)
MGFPEFLRSLRQRAQGARTTETTEAARRDEREDASAPAPQDSPAAAAAQGGSPQAKRRRLDAADGDPDPDAACDTPPSQVRGVGESPGDGGGRPSAVQPSVGDEEMVEVEVEVFEEVSEDESADGHPVGTPPRASQQPPGVPLPRQPQLHSPAAASEQPALGREDTATAPDDGGQESAASAPPPGSGAEAVEGQGEPAPPPAPVVARAVVAAGEPAEPEQRGGPAPPPAPAEPAPPEAAVEPVQEGPAPAPVSGPPAAPAAAAVEPAAPEPAAPEQPAASKPPATPQQGICDASEASTVLPSQPQQERTQNDQTLESLTQCIRKVEAELLAVERSKKQEMFPQARALLQQTERRRAAGMNFRVGLVGLSGTGKSELLNAMLGHEGLLPVGVDARACTASPVEIAGGDHFCVRANFHSREDWAAELRGLALLAAEPGELVEEGKAARARLEGFFGRAVDPSAVPDVTESPLYRHLGTTLTKEGLPGVQELKEELEALLVPPDSVDVEGEPGEPRLWPIIKKVRVEGSFPACPALQRGVVLVDLPGMNDTSRMRERTAREEWGKLDCFVLAVHVSRCKTDQAALRMVEDSDLATLLRRGKHSVTVVVTKCDEGLSSATAVERIVQGMDTEREELRSLRKQHGKQLRSAPPAVRERMQELSRALASKVALDRARGCEAALSAAFDSVVAKVLRNLREAAPGVELRGQGAAVPVFATSAQEFINLELGMGQGGIFASRDHTGIPALRRHLLALVAPERQLYFRELFLGTRSALDSALQVLSRETGAQDKVREVLLQAQGELCEAARCAAGAFHADLARVRTDILRPALDGHRGDADRRMMDRAQEWRSMAWQTHAAAIRKGGTHRAASGLQVDMARSVTAAIETHALSAQLHRCKEVVSERAEAAAAAILADVSTVAHRTGDRLCGAVRADSHGAVRAAVAAALGELSVNLDAAKADWIRGTGPITAAPSGVEAKVATAVGHCCSRGTQAYGAARTRKAEACRQAFFAAYSSRKAALIQECHDEISRCAGEALDAVGALCTGYADGVAPRLAHYFRDLGTAPQERVPLLEEAQHRLRQQLSWCCALGASWIDPMLE